MKKFRKYIFQLSYQTVYTNVNLQLNKLAICKTISAEHPLHTACTVVVACLRFFLRNRPISSHTHTYIPLHTYSYACRPKVKLRERNESARARYRYSICRSAAYYMPASLKNTCARLNLSFFFSLSLSLSLRLASLWQTAHSIYVRTALGRDSEEPKV